MKPILVIGIGNDARGDDALGPLLLRRLAEEGFPECEFLEVYQLQIEHALDLAGRQQVLFIDAGLDTPAPYTHYRIEAATADTPFSHALSPEALLSVCLKLHGSVPAAQVLCIRGEYFELGASLSRTAMTHLQQAHSDFAARLREGC
jgi:hydrogenase maturation protease